MKLEPIVTVGKSVMFQHEPAFHDHWNVSSKTKTCYIGVVACFVLICINCCKGNMSHLVFCFCFFLVPTVCCLLILEVKRVVSYVDCKAVW